jgi:hypothetical protein
VTFAQQLKTQSPGLSLPDCFALACATRLKHVLVTGDQHLKKKAKGKVEAIYGLLWMLDQMAAAQVVPASLLADGLQRLLDHPRTRLPASEVTLRIEAWSVAPSAGL